ncbi:hypothetical protein [Sphingomonas sp. 66-10]|uniref:hypothetical protein n=1 Tax=Sphingomonas sp. 66-10 TaxID=1895848 RepID=UPI00257F3836|nr:hypothetical protein [Sphingomonas sp. 66-10]
MGTPDRRAGGDRAHEGPRDARALFGVPQALQKPESDVRAEQADDRCQADQPKIVLLGQAQSKAHSDSSIRTRERPGLCWQIVMNSFISSDCYIDVKILIANRTKFLRLQAIVDTRCHRDNRNYRLGRMGLTAM